MTARGATLDATPGCYTVDFRLFEKRFYLKDLSAIAMPWRREWDSNPRYGIGTCRGDAVTIPDKQSRSKERLSGFMLRVQHLTWLPLITPNPTGQPKPGRQSSRRSSFCVAGYNAEGAQFVTQA
ncbi:hypothetical protein [Bradyrhizobium japonicum]|uniref:hypothetical protein n=1 Tax=Bradyrhizobium japonicum TaxID=375 RepID=UPI00117D4AFB|nr:hypothetical protein [Bradyrhizobium japonicum]